MADYVPISQGSGVTVATDDVGGAHYQRIKISDGTADSSNHWVIDSAGSGQIALKGNVTIDSGTVTIGSALPAGTNAIGKLAANSGVDIGDVDVTSNTAWADPNTFIGLATVEVANTVTADVTGQGDVPVTLDGEKVGIAGNVTISDSKGFIGLVSVSGFASPMPVSQSGTWNVGTVTSVTNDVNIADGGNSITVDGNVGVLGNVTLSDPKGFVGLVSVSGFVSPLPVDATGQGDVPVTLAGEKVGIVGNVTVDQVDVVTSITNPIALKGNVTIDSGSVDVSSIAGNVTVSISGPAQTIHPHSIKLSTASVATIAVPTNTFKITSLVMNSDATVRVSIKSGATYLTGNASIGIVLNPGGGFVKDGSVDAPSFTGLADAEAIVVEKFDMTGTAANVGGYLSYYEG